MKRGLVIMAVLVAVLAACDGDVAHPDAPASAWQLGPSLPRRALAPGVAAYGQRVAVVGGFDGTSVTARVDVFDVLDQQWLPLEDAPVAWTDLNVAAIGVSLYLLGGLDSAGVAHGETYHYDPSELDPAKRWKPLAPLPSGLERGGAAIATAPGRIYLLGGASSTGAVASCLEYDLAADAWTELPTLPAPRVHPAVMRRSDGSLVVAGGFASLDAAQPSTDVWVRPPLGETWSPRGQAPGAPLHGGCAYGTVLAQLVCAGGQADQTGQAAVDSYDPYLDEWTAREPMPVPRGGTQGAAVGGRLYVPGGAADGQPTDTLYIYTPLDTAPR